MTYREAYDYGVHHLNENHISEAELDARLLLEYVCHTDRNALLVHGEQEITDKEKEQYQKSIAKRADRIPLQHITGVQEFMGLEFLVSPSVLIPRQDTEILVEEVMKHLHDGMRILDVCTGSGCILLSLLHYSNNCQGTGIDISPQALEIARRNGENLGIDAEFLLSNLFEKAEGRFDVIVSNPPYIPSGEIANLMEEVRAHEPILALDGTEDGLFFYREIGRDARKYLNRGGRLFFETGHDQGEAVMEILKDLGYTDIGMKKDYAGLDRVVCSTFLEEAYV